MSLAKGRIEGLMQREGEPLTLSGVSGGPVRGLVSLLTPSQAAVYLNADTGYVLDRPIVQVLLPMGTSIGLADTVNGSGFTGEVVYTRAIRFRNEDVAIWGIVS